MPASNTHRCPSCGKMVDVASLKYSESAKDFVCQECRSASAPDPAPAAAAAAATSRARNPKLPWMIATGVFSALCVALVVLVLVKRSPTDDRRAWEDANREKIVALKSEAETLLIENKLAESHAKYRELEKLVGGRTIGDPRLFDLVDQARLDQSRVYMMIMHAMAPGVINPNNGLPPQVAAKTPAPAPAPPPAPAPSPASEPVEVPDTGASYAPPSQQRQQQQQRAQRWMERAPASAPALPPEISGTSSAKTQATTVAAARSPTVPAAPVNETASTNPAVPVNAPSLDAVTDAQVERALLKGADYLLAQFDAAGELQHFDQESEVEHEGLDALALYALLQASKAVTHPKLGIHGDFLPPALAKLKSFAVASADDIDPPATYTRSLRASALATYNRPEDREALTADVKWLINAAVDGAYTYDDRYSAPARGPRSRRRVRTGEIGDTVRALDVWRGGGATVTLIHNGEIMLPPGPPGPPVPPPVPTRGGYRTPTPTYGNMPVLPRRYKPQTEYQTPFFWDNSNSQYGLLGVWAGAEVGVEVPDKYWKAVRKHWTDCQLPSGQWSYIPGSDATYSMTCGGIASLLIAHDYLDAPLLGTGRTANQQKPYDDALTAGLAYLEDGDNVVNFLQTAPNNMLFAGYNLFGLERVGLASGLKYFGSHNWFAELCRRILPTQWPGGAWGRMDQQGRLDPRQAVIDTSYILLFLARGRHPILMNKLKFEGPWTNRPRDVANLAAFAGREMERPVNWQAVDLSRTPDDWADAPILYLASNRALELAPEDVAKLKQFVDDGGLLFTHADLSSGSFNTWAAGLAKTLWPQYPLTDLPADHSIYSLNFKLPKPHPRLQGVSNGSRLLMIHSPVDLASAWQTRAIVSKKEIFQLGVNLYVYTTGKERFRNRLDTRAVPEPSRDPAPTIDIAQLQYDGEWNPEPSAWPRFAKVFQNATGTRINVHAAKAAELDAGKFLITLITGIGAKVPADADLPPLKKFLDDGGTILIDACGGSGDFANAIEAWLARLAPAAKLDAITPEDELFKDLPPKGLRLYALEQLRNDVPRLKQATVGKGRIVFSALDIRSGLLGTNTWDVLGYLPEYSEGLMKNFVLATSRRDAGK